MGGYVEIDEFELQDIPLNSNFDTTEYVEILEQIKALNQILSGETVTTEDAILVVSKMLQLFAGSSTRTSVEVPFLEWAGKVMLAIAPFPLSGDTSFWRIENGKLFTNGDFLATTTFLSSSPGRYSITENDSFVPNGPFEVISFAPVRVDEDGVWDPNGTFLSKRFSCPPQLSAKVGDVFPERLYVTSAAGALPSGFLSGCATLADVQFSPSYACQSLPQNAFRDCQKLSAVSIPQYVISADAGAFCGCGSLKFAFTSHIDAPSAFLSASPSFIWCRRTITDGVSMFSASSQTSHGDSHGDLKADGDVHAYEANFEEGTVSSYVRHEISYEIGFVPGSLSEILSQAFSDLNTNLNKLYADMLRERLFGKIPTLGATYMRLYPIIKPIAKMAGVASDTFKLMMAIKGVLKNDNHAGENAMNIIGNGITKDIRLRIDEMKAEVEGELRDMTSKKMNYTEVYVNGAMDSQLMQVINRIEQYDSDIADMMKNLAGNDINSVLAGFKDYVGQGTSLAIDFIYNKYKNELEEYLNEQKPQINEKLNEYGKRAGELKKKLEKWNAPTDFLNVLDELKTLFDGSTDDIVAELKRLTEIAIDGLMPPDITKWIRAEKTGETLNSQLSRDITTIFNMHRHYLCDYPDCGYVTTEPECEDIVTVPIIAHKELSKSGLHESLTDKVLKPISEIFTNQSINLEDELAKKVNEYEIQCLANLCPIR